MRKAGWSGKRDRWREVEPNMDVVRYKGKALSMDYEVFKEWREWFEKELNSQD
jgi:hypothetical protein